MIRSLYRFAACLILITAFGCSGGNAYKEHIEDFPNKVWKKGRSLTFTPEIKDSSVSYKMLLDFRHVHKGFPASHLKLRTKIKSPSGSTREKDHSILIKEKKNGNVRLESDCSGDICDRKATLVEELHFKEKGKYKIEVQHRMPMKELPNVMGVGLLLKKNMSGEDVAVQKDAVQGR